MKKRSLLSLVLALVSTVALQADLVLVQKVENMGMDGEVTMKIKGDSIRMDVSKDMSVVLDGVSGSMTSIMHEKKEFITLDGAAIQQMMKSVAAASQAKGGKPPEVKLVATGKTEEIAGVKTEIYELAGAPQKGSFWIAKDYPNGAAILAALKKLQDLPMSKMASEMAPQPTDFPGVPVKTEIEIAPGQKVTTSLLSAKEETLDATLFEAPKDYKAMAMPMLPGATGAPSAPGAGK